MKHIASTFISLSLLASAATMAHASDAHKHKSKKPATRLEQTVAVAHLEPASVAMIGTWTLRNGDQPRTDIKMRFGADGTFAFIGPNWQSKGTFRVLDHKLHLEWTSVDGSKVEAGSMHKDFPMADDSTSFTIDQYTYFKLPK